MRIEREKHPMRRPDLKICFAELSEKMADDFEFGSDIGSL